MSTNKENKEEEVDLGSLFIVIGNGFKSFFNFIWKILTGIFDFAIGILLFFRGNVIKLLIAAVIGAGIGVYQEFGKEDTYGADLVVEPNFNSSRQLYNTIGYYNNLIAEGDSTSIGKVFNITPKQAATLKGFSVTPVKTDNDKIELYFEMVKAYDTVATVNYSFDEFKKTFTDYNYKFHIIHVEAVDNKIFSSLDKVIISSIIENEYFNKLRKLKTENLYRKDSLLKKNLDQVDTLRQVYMDVMIQEAKKESQGTNIDLGGQKRSTKEIELFQTSRVINNDLEKIYEDLSDKSEIINVISNFQKIGYPIGGIRQNAILINAVLGVFLVILILLLLQLNRYLGSYKKG